jgi:hypothetical protein
VEANFKERNAPGPNLHITTRFSDDVYALGPIRIRIALCRAYLNFQLFNCEFPLASNLENTWPVREKTKTTIKTRSSRQQTDNEEISIRASVTPSVKIGDPLDRNCKSARLCGQG